MFWRFFYTGAVPAPLLRNCCLQIGTIRGRRDASGHMCEVLRAGLRVLAEGARALAGDVAEGAAESAQASPARVERDLADGHLRVAQQRLGFLDAAGEQVAVGWEAEGFLELAGEVGGGDVAHFSQAFDGPFLVGGGVHAVLRAQEAAEEVGVLGVGRCH